MDWWWFGAWQLDLKDGCGVRSGQQPAGDADVFIECFSCPQLTAEAGCGLGGEDADLPVA